MNARNRLAMLSDSESELFVTQSSFSGSRSIDLSENNFESLFAVADNEKAINKFNLRTEDQQLIFWGPQWKAMNHRLRKSVNVRQKKTLLSSILVIVASYLIFSNKHL